MQPTNTGGRALAIAAGLLFTAGALAILLEDVIINHAPWALKHFLTIITVAGTMMVGHLAGRAKANRHWLAMAGFAVLFTAGTGLTVYSSVGRQAEHTMVAAAEVDAADKARKAAEDGLTSASAMLAEAQADLARECKTGKGKRCDGIGATIAVYEAAVKGHKADLAKLGPPKVAVPEARRAGEIGAVFGLDASKVEAAAILLVPFLTTLLFEFGAIVSLGYAFGNRRQPANDNRTDELSEIRAKFFAPEVPDDPKPGKTVVPFTPKKMAVLRTIRTELNQGRTFPSQRELCRKFGIPRSTMSDWLTEWERDESIPARRMDGRCKRLAS